MSNARGQARKARVKATPHNAASPPRHRALRFGVDAQAPQGRIKMIKSQTLDRVGLSLRCKRVLLAARNSHRQRFPETGPRSTSRE